MRLFGHGNDNSPDEKPGDAADTPHKPLFKLPWQHTPEEEALRRQQAADQAALLLRAEQVRQAEMLRQTRDLQSLASGGLPQQAAERLREIGSNASGAGSLFTSNLAPEEAGLLRRVGYEPLGMVTGSAVYHVGQAYASAYDDCEVKVLSDAYNHATELAISRMRQEVTLIGAHGVVGVRLSIVRHEWADKTIEVQAIGTAVRGPGAKPSLPWMCDLAGQEWYALHRAGYEPAGLVWGHATWFILTTYNDEWTERSWSNVELDHFSSALSRVRHIAMATLIAQAKRAGAIGVTGVRIERRLDEVRLTGFDQNPAYEREHHNLVLSIIGTAIKIRPGSKPSVPVTTNVLSLRDGRLTPVGMSIADLTVE
jgi:uncharacterized protein YbjQ (UPF0145 family)